MVRGIHIVVAGFIVGLTIGCYVTLTAITAGVKNGVAVLAGAVVVIVITAAGVIISD